MGMVLFLPISQGLGIHHLVMWGFKVSGILYGLEMIWDIEGDRDSGGFGDLRRKTRISLRLRTLFIP